MMATVASSPGAERRPYPEVALSFYFLVLKSWVSHRVVGSTSSTGQLPAKAPHHNVA
jgi:hypothetical protein